MPGLNDQPFRCEVHVRGTAAHIRPVGELDIATCSLVEAHLVDCAAAGFEQLTFDLRALSFLDATGLRLILLWNTMSRTEGFAYRLIAGPLTSSGSSTSPAHASDSTSSTCLRARSGSVSAPRAPAACAGAACDLTRASAGCAVDLGCEGHRSDAHP
jgi:anti-anti-sigma factor